MRVLVTGAAGAVGSAIIPAVAARGHSVTAVDRVDFTSSDADRVVVGDLVDKDVVLDALVGVDRIVHMGAYPSPEGHPDDVIFSSNTRSTYLVLAEGAERGVDRAVVASSVSAVGIAWAPHDLRPDYVPVDEEHPFVVEDPYGLSKRVTEDICAMVTRRWSMDTMAMRFPFIGRGERLERHLAEFAADPLKTRRELWGWIHTEDVVRAVTASLLGAWSGHHVVNVAAPDSGLDIPTEQLLSGYLPGVEVRRELRGFASLYDSRRIRDLIGFEARYTWRGRERQE